MTDNDNDTELKDVVTASRGNNLWDDWRTQYGNIQMRNSRPWKQFHPDDLELFRTGPAELRHLRYAYKD